MKKTILLTLFAISCMVFSQESAPPQFTSLTREFNRAATAAAARAVIGASSSGSGGELTNAVIYGSTSGSVSFGATANATFSGGKTITTDTGGLTLTTGAANGNITLTPHGTGYTILNGNVGIGATTPSQKLDVAGRIIVNNNFGYTQRSSAGVTVTVLNVTSSDNLTFGQTSTQNDIYFNVGSVANALNIKATSGNVGIGTTAPDKALEINSATGANLRLTYNDSNGSAANYADFSISSSGDLTIAPSGGDTTITGRLATTSTSVTIAAAAATFAITSNVVTVTGDAGANTVTTITGGVSGQILTLIFADGLVTITDDATGTANTINLSAAFTSTANDVMTLVFNGTSWREVSRSVN